ncbi:MAG: hypothetical protein AAFR73_01955 [Pseudomonadota bacterium]
MSMPRTGYSALQIALHWIAANFTSEGMARAQFERVGDRVEGLKHAILHQALWLDGTLMRMFSPSKE